MGILALSATIKGILLAVLIVGGVGLIIGIVLGIAGKFFAVEVNETEAAITKINTIVCKYSNLKGTKSA